MFSSYPARIYCNGTWSALPAGSGSLPNGLFAKRLLRQTGPWQCMKWEFTNQGTAPVVLGSCHLAETKTLSDSGLEDTIYLDSGGGWFAGVVRVTSQLPNMDWEYWKEIFCAQEDLDWARQIQRGQLETASHYSLGGVSIYLRPEHPALFFGFLAPRQRCTAMPVALNDPQTGRVRCLAFVNNFAGYELAPGETIATETAIWRMDENPHRLLEEFADFCVAENHLALHHATPPVGWLSWYGYRLEITEQEALRIADFIKQEYPGFGFKVFQVDLGYNTQNLPGQWFGTNSHFPGGLANFSAQLRQRGFIPGIWCAAFCVAESSDFYREHPDACMRWSGDAPGTWFWEPREPLYYLDPTHPATHQFVANVLKHFKEAGIEYFKIDFLNRLGRVDAGFRPRDPKAVKGTQVYRAAIKTLADSMAPSDYLYTCSNLFFDSVGLVSTSMTACDIANTGIRQALAQGDDSKLKFYRMQFATTMARYYLHRKFLLLNPDGICIAPPADREEAWFRTLFVGLSGGQVFLGDRFDLAEPEIRSYVRKVLPPYGEAAKPVDLFLKPYPDARPEILHLHTPTHEIVGLFQFTNDSNISLNFNDLCMNGKYEVWEFYERKYLGVVDTEQPFAYPMACPTARLLFFTPVSSEPQVIATDFHITGGTVELQKLHYDAATLTLSGELCRPSGDKGSLYVSVPERLTCNLPQAAPGVVELKLQATSEPLHWSIPFQSN